MKHRNKLCSQMASMLLAIGWSSSVFASDENYEQCILSALSRAESQQNIEWLKEQCASLEADVEEKTKESKANADFPERSPEQKISRLKMEYTTEDNPFVITPYRLNYILPVTHMTNVNTQPYGDDRFGGKADDLSDEEIKLQLSLKIPVVDDGVFNQEDKIYFGFTLKSFWQAYSSDISAPFRETNYRPELFYETPLNIESADGVWFSRFGLEHESNGRTEELSRSWNRVYTGLGYIEDDFLVYIQPWYRIPESSSSDDNPDIEDYLGHYELSGAYKWEEFELSALGRYNFQTGYGGVQTSLSFPLFGRLKGYVQYYKGYGESLIDYDYNSERIGVGVLLTNAL
ncbi:Phospholipase A1 precursor; Outer membrane phospholipase A [Vibrio chagasii]|nr:Phospholipase A1 precursor; Outer membrane phospholipase A [Vibrio chagasii]CAH7169285.1 Phospholipase A1 precursor; Outer membrane phospholipase A [Vibrio chagasii]CAH7296568.1 Phospholipase A1 precursor; Outer membrane phospholipase A [Vibrio chagasii]